MLEKSVNRPNGEPQEAGDGHARGAATNGGSARTRASASRGQSTRSSGSAGTAGGPAGLRPGETLHDETTRLLEARGLDSELVIRHGITTAVMSDGGSDCIAIPYVRHGATVNHKYRRVRKHPERLNFAQDKGGVQTWWNHDALLDTTLADQPLVITEGELDALAAMQAGFQRVVSVPGGAPSKPTEGEGGAKYGFIADTLPLMHGCREIILAVDDDEPGLALMHDLSTRLDKGRCKYVSYPDGCKDLLDTLLGHGEGAVTQALNSARWCHVSGLFRMSELPPIPDPVACNSRISGLVDHYQLRRGDFTVVTGVPGSGKTTFVNDLVCRMAEHHSWTTVFASFEQTPQTDHRRALRTWCNRKPEASQSAGELDIADHWIDRHFAFVVGDEEEDATLEWLLEKLAAAVIRYGACMAVIDPWNEMDHARPPAMSLTEYTGTAIKDLKRFARKMDVHLIVVAHPWKMRPDKDGKIPTPSLYDISDSAHWYNKPEVGIVVHPSWEEELGDYTAVKVQKVRYHEKIGKPGTVKLRFDPHSARFHGAV